MNCFTKMKQSFHADVRLVGFRGLTAKGDLTKLTRNKPDHQHRENKPNHKSAKDCEESTRTSRKVLSTLQPSRTSKSDREVWN